MNVLEHLKSRHFDSVVHTVWVDDDEGVATYPLWNLTGQMVGYQQYRPSATKKRDNHPRDSRYFNWRKDKVVGAWGLESWKFSNTLFVTEGVFDACRLTSRGFSAVALLSNDIDSSTREWLYMVKSNRFVVAVCDNDVAGRKLAKCGHVAHVMEDGKDMGEASDEYVTNFLKEYK
jgi:hypothetical protein